MNAEESRAISPQWLRYAPRGLEILHRGYFMHDVALLYGTIARLAVIADPELGTASIRRHVEKHCNAQGR